MRKIREVLRLKWTSQLSNRTIAQSCSIARSSVAECLERTSKAGLSWPLPDDLDDTALERLLFSVRMELPLHEKAVSAVIVEGLLTERLSQGSKRHN